jgi:hypothetical protein
MKQRSGDAFWPQRVLTLAARLGLLRPVLAEASIGTKPNRPGVGVKVPLIRGEADGGLLADDCICRKLTLAMRATSALRNNQSTDAPLSGNMTF